MRLEQLEAGSMMPVVAVDVGIERPGVDDQRDDVTSPEMISSIRSEMSDRPLAPAPAASRRRRPPRGASSKVSIASRVSSDTVTPRRFASCRRRASSSSGSFTVVRCTYASIPSAGSSLAERQAVEAVGRVVVDLDLEPAVLVVGDVERRAEERLVTDEEVR